MFYDPFEAMNRVDSITNLLLKAMRAERHDTVKYKRMMDMTNDPLVKKQINFAYEDELKHYNMFNRIFQRLTGRKVNIPFPTQIETYNSLLDAVMSSIEGENEAVDLYREIYGMLSDKQMRDMVFEIITDEQEHAGRFIYLYAMLK